MVVILPIILQDDKYYFVDERLKELRNCYNPHDRMDLNDFELEHYKDIINGEKDIHIKFVPFETFKRNDKPMR